MWQARDVPHGKVEINWQRSTVLNGETRWIWIYTPPGYTKETKRRYPVLYLFHGSNDVAAGWTLAGCANLILDNLLAEKKAVPMIVVMPYGHAVPFGAPREQQANNTALFEQYLLKDVVPLVESKYRTAPGREKRAIAGLSMGGGQALTIGFSHLDHVQRDRRIQFGSASGLRNEVCERAERREGDQRETQAVVDSVRPAGLHLGEVKEA